MPKKRGSGRTKGKKPRKKLTKAKPRGAAKAKAKPKATTKKPAVKLAPAAHELLAAAAPKAAMGSCWFKDPNGRSYCVPSPSAEACKDAGGQWNPAPCPNT